MSSCCDVNQLECGLHSLQLSLANASIKDWSMNLDSSMSQSFVSQQDNQNAAALSAEEGIAKLLSRTNYSITKENGQRRYGPPPNWTGETPPRGCEVFVGKIPRDCFEDELIPIFEKIGPIYMFRLMMEFNGHNRGYGFCVYTTRDDAKRAVDELNNFEIRKGKTIGVCLSVDNCRLFVGGIPKNKTKEEIFIEMQKVTDGVKDVICYPSVADKTKNRGFAFVEYESHKAAAMARRKLIPGRIQPWGQQIAVDWAEPEREVNEEIMSKVKILYVRNLMLSTSEDQLRTQFLEAAGAGDQAIERVKKISDYAFIHFKDREVAQRCLEKLNGATIDGSIVEVTWAKPADKGEPVRSQSARSAKQLMDWTLNGEIANNPNYFLDPTAALLAAFNPLMLPGSGCPRSSSARLGRRNAAGGRSAAAQRERKHPVEKLQQHQSNPMVYQEIMEDFCQRNGLESPVFTALPVDIVDYTTGGKIQLFIGQVIISSLRLQYLTPRYYSTAEEAKVGAAETAVYNLYYNQLQLAMGECQHLIGFGSDDEAQSTNQPVHAKNRKNKKRKDEIKPHRSVSPIAKVITDKEEKKSIKEKHNAEDDQYLQEVLGSNGTIADELERHCWCHSTVPYVPTLTSVPAVCECCCLTGEILQAPILLGENQVSECCKTPPMNGTVPPQTTGAGGITPNVSTASLLPIVFPQTMTNRSLPFSPLSCQSSLYPPSQGSLTPILPISTYDSGPPLQNLPLQNQILDFQSQLLSNPLLHCGGMIPAGALVVDPSSITTQTSNAAFGGIQSGQTTSAEHLAEFKQKPLESQINGGTQMNFLPSLITGLSTSSSTGSQNQPPTVTAGSMNFQISVSPADSILTASQMNLNGLPASTTVAGAAIATQSLLNSLNSTASS